MRLIHQENLLNLSARFKIPIGKWRGLLFVFDGDAAAGITVAATDLGTVKISSDGVVKSNFTLSKLQALNAIDYGACETTSNAGSTFRFSVFMPFVYPNSPYAYIVRPEKNIEVVATFSAMVSSLIDSGQFKCFAIPSDKTALCPYELNYNDFDLTFGAAATAKPEQIKFDNISRVLVESDTQLSSLQVKKDGETLFDQIDKDDLTAYVNLFGFIETFSSSYAWLLIDILQSGDLVSAQNDYVEFVFTVAAACTVQILVETMNLTPVKFQQSMNERNYDLLNKSSRKQSKNLAAIASTIQAAT